MILKAKKRLGAKEGDHITLINIFIRYKIISNKKERSKLCFENGLNEYYRHSGWEEKSGIPKRVTLERLGLTLLADNMQLEKKMISH